MNGVIICYSRCWACMSGCCFDPPKAHPWWDQEDVEHAEATDQPAPAGDCACPCAKEST